MGRRTIAWTTAAIILLGGFVLAVDLGRAATTSGKAPGSSAPVLRWMRRDLHDLGRFLFPSRYTRCDGGLKQLELALALASLHPRAEPAVDAENLRPGLVTRFSDGKVELLRLEPTIAFALKAGEAFHPRLAADRGTVEWTGYVNLLRPGPYRFSANVRGKFRLRVAGQEVLVAEETGEQATLHEGPEVRLEAGVQPLIAEFTRLPGMACVELFWQAPHFYQEPLPHDHLGHVAAQESPQLAEEQAVEQGRVLAEEHNCVRCHQPDGQDRIARGLVTRQAPDLSQVGGRVFPGWLYRWVVAPHKLQPGAVMPQLFDEDEAGCVEAYAVARYLVSLGGPLKPESIPQDARRRQRSLAQGQRLLTSLGCIACHRARPGAADLTLKALGSKTTPEKLAAYLANPLAIDPSGRMPHMVLQGDEARDLALFLCQSKDPDLDTALPAAPGEEQLVAAFRRVEPRAEELEAFRQLSADRRLVDLGQRLVIDRGCNNCHTIAPGGKPFANVLARASFEDIKKPAVHHRGCLADSSKAARSAAPESRPPRFHLSEADRAALRRFLKEGTSGAGSPAPTYAARVTLQRFNCLACHSRDGQGGLTPELLEELRRVERVDNAEAVSPPPLTDVGHKLRTPWLRQVLLHAGRARPWMGLRMPQFGEANVGRMPVALAALDGTEPDDRVHEAALTPAKIEVGRKLVGKTAFGCISCHDLAGIPNTGTRGPDLALMNQRVRYAWYRRWLEQPQRMQPGTRMPQVFPEGKSTLPDLLGGRADAQAEAMWAYLSLGPNLPLPEGMEPPKGLILTVKDRPILLRTFMPDAGSRAVAVGYPGGVSVAFDFTTCRLAYAWSGNFLDASPVWNDRGGNPAKPLGARFWTAPPGCPWGVTASSSPPDFAAQAKDPAYGAPLPEGKLYEGPRRLHFEGYREDKAGTPTFRYQVNADEPHPAEVSERPEPLRRPVAVGVARHFMLDLPAQRTAWLWAGEANATPRLLDPARNNIATLDDQQPTTELPAEDRLLVLPQGGGRAVVLAVPTAPPGTRWCLRRQDGRWQALLCLPTTSRPARVAVRLDVWVPYRDDPELLKDFLSRK